MTDLTELSPPILPHLVNWHLAAWQNVDASAILNTLHPDVEFRLPALHWYGQAKVYPHLAAHLKELSELRLHPRHILIDAGQRAAAIEWVGRAARPNRPDYSEFLGGTVLDFDPAGLIYRWRTYLDPFQQRTLTELEAPWPDQGWSPCPNPGPPPSPQEMIGLIRALAQGWSNHNLAQLLAVAHAEIIIQPPWDYVVGQAALAAGAEIYFANYSDTQVTPQRFILDPSQPYFGVCEQTFACTNLETGQNGQDHDFAFFEIAQGKLRYWRTYFDTSRSVQVVEKTAGYVLAKG